jgi:2-polyprenyl-3-methyl-5-hydroxy-6-metoxy-1,4-benzoquinol methylase
MTRDPKAVVAHGYDVIGETYWERYGRSIVRDRWVGDMIVRLRRASRVLDLGCGAGVPVARQLTENGFNVVGIDASGNQVKLAQRNVPNAEFICADMTGYYFSCPSQVAPAVHYRW